jgi:hypothetical protein
MCHKCNGVQWIKICTMFQYFTGPGWHNELDYLTPHTILSPIRRGFAPGFVHYKTGCTRLAATSDNVYQLLAHGWWFSPGTSAYSTTKTGRHDITEILLNVRLNTKNLIKKIKSIFYHNTGSMVSNKTRCHCTVVST